MKKSLILLIFLITSVALVSGFAITGNVIEISPTSVAVHSVEPGSTGTAGTVTTTNRGCVDMCGDGVCQEVVCSAEGCPCPETAQSCPEDCGSEGRNPCDLACQDKGYESGVCRRGPAYMTTSDEAQKPEYVGYCYEGEVDIGAGGCPEIAIMRVDGTKAQPYHCCCKVKDEERCADEGQYTTGALGPEYYVGCCEGLKEFDTYKGINIVGAGMLCYNPRKGTPECKHGGTEREGWYYSQTGELLRLEDCEKEEGDCYSDRDCDGDEFCEFPAGACGGKGECTEKPEVCAAIYAPVCGCDGRTYASDCSAAAKGVSIKHKGECDEEPEPVCKPVCRAMGSRSEGWYDSCTGDLIKYDNCACVAVCRGGFGFGEGEPKKPRGYYNSCTGTFIVEAECWDPEEPVEVDIKEKKVRVEQEKEDGFVLIKSQETARTQERIRVSEGRLGMHTDAGVRQIEYLPEEVMQKAVESKGLYKVKNINLIQEEGSPVYELVGKVKTKILGIIPLGVRKTVKINAETNQVIE